MEINGWAADGWGPVADALQEGFERDGELGAAVSVYMGGQEKLHLFGGYCDSARTRPWQADTLVQPASSIKGVHALTVHKLVSDGMADYDDPVTKYWPAFAQGGKSGITIRHLLGHTAALEGSFSIDLYKATLSDALAAIEPAVPAFAPGSKGKYHSLTIMPLLSALVFKITGESLHQFFRREVGGPWAIDAFPQLPQSESPRAAPVHVPRQSFYFPMMEGFLGKAPAGADELILPVQPEVNDFNDGYAGARGLARLWGGLANGGTLDNVSLFSPAVAAACGEPQWTSDDWYPGDNPSYAERMTTGTLGFFRAGGEFPMGPGENSWGSPGAGGNLAMADPDRALGFGYVCNRWPDGSGQGPRVRRLIDAVYRCVDDR
jgi:CubicO group peptidase (beta-lactamase class C family)